MKKELQQFLQKNPRKNIATIGFFNNFPVNKFYTDGNSAIIFGESDNYWAHLVSSSEKELEQLLAKHHLKTDYYFSVEGWMIPILLKFRDTDWIMTTNRYILANNISTQQATGQTVQIEPTYAVFIYKNSDYKAYTSVNYIKHRLAENVSAVIITDNQLVAWGFIHDDGALGFLHVLPEYRKRGYANEVVLSLIH